MALKPLIAGQFYNSSSGGGSPGGSNGQVQYNNSGAFGGLTGLTTSGGVLRGASIAGGTVVVSTPPLSITQTWNDAGVQFTGVLINITNTASNASSLLMDLQVGGSGVFNVRRDGVVHFNTAEALSGAITFYSSGGNLAFATIAGGINLNNGSAILLGKAAGTLQLGLDAAGVTNQMLTAANRTGSDGPGAHIKIAGGNGLGGAGGSVILSTYTTAATGVAGTLTDRLTIDTTGLITTQGLTIAPPSGSNTSITATTGNSLTLATLDGNKNIVISPHGTGQTFFSGLGSSTAGQLAFVEGSGAAAGLWWDSVNGHMNILTAGGGTARVAFSGASVFTVADNYATLGQAANRWAQLFLGPTGIKIGDGTSGPSITASGSSPNEDLLLNTVGSGTLDITGVVTASETVTVDKTLTIKVNGTAIKIPYVNA